MNLRFTLLAATALAFASTFVHEANGEDDIPYAQEPELYGPDATVAFVDEPGYTDANSTQALTFSDVSTMAGEAGARDLLVVEGAIVGFQIMAAAAPIITQIIQGQRKECQQVACWVSTDSRPCALSVGERVQRDVMMNGRDRYRYESLQPNGMWVRYWRTKFEPADRGDIVSGKCSNDAAFTVTNCQSTGRVKC